MLMRLAGVSDAQEILNIYAPYVENTAITFETEIPSRNEMEARIELILCNHVWIVVEGDGKILGYAYASEYHERAAYRWSVDVSIYVREDRQGGGIGKALYASLFRVLGLQGYRNAYAIICLPNERSIGVHEHFGFRKMAHFNNVGYKFGKWHDVGWWELFLQEHGSDPKEPLSINNIDEIGLQAAFQQGLEILKN
ncbi:MAG: arsinothricin resistance N-acetyltransferase ArsN1 family B [Desulfitobacteriaceae bacterium]